MFESWAAKEKAVVVIPESAFANGRMDETERRSIKFSDLYEVLSFGPPGEYVLRGA